MNDPKNKLAKLAIEALENLTPGEGVPIPHDLSLANTQAGKQIEIDLAGKNKPGEQLPGKAQS